MSNSDKFDQDDAIVADEPDQLAGVLGGADAGEPAGTFFFLFLSSSYHFEADPPPVSVAFAEIVDDADERSNDEFDGIKRENIIDDSGLLSEVGARNTRQKDYGAADREADALVEDVADNQNSGKSRIAQ
ncbi:hypothetical protein JCM11251_007869 [Rhodosporidiobolus azoricus]